MSDKILLKILAISVAVLMVASCMTLCIAVGDLNEHKLKTLSDSEEESSKSNYTFSLQGNVSSAIEWHTSDQEAMQIAKSQNKPTMIFFFIAIDAPRAKNRRMYLPIHG